MDVEEDKWVHVASENIDKYLHRGGNGKGNEPQQLGGTSLLNLIGIAMGLPLCDPKKWTQSEFDQASRGELVFFEGKSLEAINVIADTIRGRCNGDDKCFITVVPIELYANKKLYEIPVFKIQRYRNSKVIYVDNIGRYYESFDDWYNNNKLPPCKMIYPQKLELQSDGEHAQVSAPYNTPAARTGEKVIEDIDIAAGVIGIGSAIGLMVLSGPAAPFLALVGVATAVWGTGRAISDLSDRDEHGQSINPFTDSTSRMLWLGIAASVASFGAMGATMRLSSVAARGLQVSNALKIITNLTNGVSVTLNTAAIVNNSIYLISHIKEMSLSDILLNAALLAFWTKATISCKSASAIIKDVHNQTFSLISQELPPGSREEFIELRSRVNNDTDLLNLFHTASKSNISLREYSEFLVDGMKYYDTVATLSPEQIEALSNLRNFVNDDLELLVGLQRIAHLTELSRKETLEVALTLWEKYSNCNVVPTDGVHLVNGDLVIGNAPPIKITELPRLSPSVIQFVGEHLSKIDTNATHEWSTEELIMLQDRGLFTTCPVTSISKTGYSTVELNGKLYISTKKLQILPPDFCETMLKMISELTPEQTTTSSKIPPLVVRLCVTEMRLRFEVQRRESVEWALKSVGERANLIEILKSDLMPHEQDRLFTFRADVSRAKADVYMNEMMNYVSDMNPKNVSEMVAYSEFVITYIDETIATIESNIRKGTMTLPRNTKKSVWLREVAGELTFQNEFLLRQKFFQIMTIVEENGMYGIIMVDKGLCDEVLVGTIRELRIRFGSKISAAYHIFKHSTEPPSAYIEQANSTIRLSNDQYKVSIGQEGDSRIISFQDAGGAAVVLEKNGVVLLCSFRATGRK